MTKLTIQYEGKTYTSECGTIEWYINDFIAKGQLIELQPQEEKTEETILQKLRAEIVRRREICKLGKYDAHGMLSDLLWFMDSLETQPEVDPILKWKERIPKLPFIAEYFYLKDDTRQNELCDHIKDLTNTLNTLIERINK